MGERGGQVVSPSQGTVTGDFYGVYFLSDGAISGLSCNLAGQDLLTGRMFYAGVLIPAVVNSISLVSGVAILLERK